MPSTWYPIWILLIFATSTGVAVFGSTFALEQVNPLKVHSEVVGLIPLCITSVADQFCVVVHDNGVVWARRFLHLSHSRVA
jgi:hypothetical protein